jgi:transposase-like protein
MAFKWGSSMSWKRFAVEQIIDELQDAQVLQTKEVTVAEVCRQMGVTEHTYYR